MDWFKLTHTLEHLFISHKTKIFEILNRISLTLKSKNLVVILTVGPDTQKCVDWLNEELTKKSTLKNVDVKTIEQSRGLEFPALLTISTEGKIAMELSEAHITGDFFLLYDEKKLGFQDRKNIFQSKRKLFLKLQMLGLI